MSLHRTAGPGTTAPPHLASQYRVGELGDYRACGHADPSTGEAVRHALLHAPPEEE